MNTDRSYQDGERIAKIELSSGLKKVIKIDRYEIVPNTVIIFSNFKTDEEWIFNINQIKYLSIAKK